MITWKKILVGIAILTLAIGTTLGCTNMGTNQKPGENQPPEALNPSPSQEEAETVVFFADAEAMYLVPEEVTLYTDNRTLPEMIIGQLISGPTEAEHNVVLPEETRLLSLEVVDGIAYVNFSEEVSTKHWGGSTGETMTIYSVVNSLTMLPEIDKVQFLVEGEMHEEIWGHSYTMEPFEYWEDIVDPAYR